MNKKKKKKQKQKRKSFAEEEMRLFFFFSCQKKIFPVFQNHLMNDCFGYLVLTVSFKTNLPYRCVGLSKMKSVNFFLKVSFLII